MVNILVSYKLLYNSLDSLFQAWKIPSIGSLVETNEKDTVRKETEEYLNQLKQITTKEDLEVNRHNM